MSEDALKALFAAEDAQITPPSQPARDVGFVITVMEKIERRRLIENLGWWLTGGVVAIAVLFVIMPYVTPVLVQFGQDVVPAVITLAVLGMIAVGWQYLAPALRDFGIPV